MLRLQPRIQDCFKLIISSSLAVKGAHEKAIRRSKAARTLEKRSELFAKYDTDRDGHLNAKEITAYAKGQFGFAVPAESLPRILGLYGDGSKVPKAKFQELKVAIGICREEEASKERRRKEEERRKMIEQKKAAYTADANKLVESLDEVEAEVMKAEEAAKVFATEEAMASADIDKALKSTQDQSDGAKGEIDIVRKQIKGLEAGEIEPELVGFVRAEVRRLEARADGFEPRLAQGGYLIRRGKDFKAKQEQLALEKMRGEVAKALRAHIAEVKLSHDDFFKAVDKDGDGRFVVTRDFLCCRTWDVRRCKSGC